MTVRRLLRAFCIGIAALAPAHAFASGGDYRQVASIALGPPERWDYVVADPGTARIYVAHGDRIAVLDARSDHIVGQVEGMPGGTHGIAISAATGQGFTDDGAKGEAVAFDLKSLKVEHRIPAAADADGMVTDPRTGRVFVVDGDPGKLTVIDPRSDSVVATIDVGAKMEYLAADRAGHVYVAGVEKSDVIVIDAASAQITAHWQTPDCQRPHGVALDAANGRLFMGCLNAKMMVLDTGSGRIVAELPIGHGNDSVAWDPLRRRVFSPNGRDGTISVFRQVTPDRYEALPTITTMPGTRTMAVDPRSGKLFAVAADFDPAPSPGARPAIRPGSVRVLVFAPAS